MDEEVLSGGVANAGAVVRVGGYVFRPTTANSGSIHRMLRWVREQDFHGAVEPAGMEPGGRERLVFIEGDVPLPPYPEWAQADRALASTTSLIHGLHGATINFEQADSSWSDELAQPGGGPVICHNDVCLENVVFQDGLAVALLDFDFAAPGHPVYDLANFCKMCVPIDDDINATRNGWVAADRPARLRLVADTYGLSRSDRDQLLTVIDESIDAGGIFVQRRVDAGDANFIAMWNEMGGAERYKRRHAWWLEARPQFVRAMVS